MYWIMEVLLPLKIILHVQNQLTLPSMRLNISKTDGRHLFSSYVNRLLNIMKKFKPTEHVDWNVDMQKQHYLQNNHIEQY